MEKISVAVRHYFGQYEEGEERPAEATPVATEESSMAKTPEEILAAEAGSGEAQEVDNVSSEDITAAEDRASASDANDAADAREEAIELDNDAVDTLVAESQEVSDEGVDDEGSGRG